jgi:hypothetical protein
MPIFGLDLLLLARNVFLSTMTINFRIYTPIGCRLHLLLSYLVFLQSRFQREGINVNNINQWNSLL